MGFFASFSSDDLFDMLDAARHERDDAFLTPDIRRIDREIFALTHELEARRLVRTTQAVMA